MTDHVVLKSFPNGIRVQLSKKPAFSEILKETAQSFQDAALFFKDASVALQFQGRKLTEEEADSLLETVKGACSLHIICLVCTDENTNDYYTKLIEKTTQDTQKEPTCQFYRGTLQDGEIYESASSVIVLGNVQKGAAVIAKGNIVVLGDLFGTAYAGGDDRRNRFIAALNMDAENLRIADLKYKKEWKNKLTLKKKQLSRMAVVEKGKIEIRELDFTKELLENNLF